MFLIDTSDVYWTVALPLVALVFAYFVWRYARTMDRARVDMNSGVSLSKTQS